MEYNFCDFTMSELLDIEEIYEIYVQNYEAPQWRD